jgi:2-methylcitrate dehydratase PrpD
MTAATAQTTITRRIVRGAQSFAAAPIPKDAVEKVKICLLDMLSCAYESLDLEPSRQAIKIASRAAGGCSTIIATPFRVAAAEAAFANATLGHGLVREDMHTGSVSHLGVVIFPTLLALSDYKTSSGHDFIRAAVCGYEVGASVGRAVMDAEVVRRFRPTGITGPLGAAVAGSLLLGLSEDAATSALGFAANTTVGLNEWPASGADEMFFHVGFAARNAVTAVELAELGAFASETALDGAAGLFAALGRADRASQVQPFENALEILSVYHKPAPACNYAQTACQAARALSTEDGVRTADIAAISVKASAAALNYPGCNAAGPFERVLQAKMSIPYCVAATLVSGAIEEANYRRLKDSELLRLVGVTTLEEDARFTQNYPRVQGTEVRVTLRNGQAVSRRLDDLVPATAADVRARFRSACPAAGEIEAFVNRLETQPDMRALTALLAANG